MEIVNVVLPEKSMDALAIGLEAITEKIHTINPGLLSHGALGGKFGYGANFENDTFMMHPFCWCEKDGCAWCDENAPNFYHKETGLKVWWYKYIGRSMETEGECENIFTLIANCLDSIA